MAGRFCDSCKSTQLELDEEDLAKLPDPVDRKVNFVQDIQPIFKEKCESCHGAHRQEAAFRVDHKPTFFAGGELGVAVVRARANNPCSYTLLQVCARRNHAAEGRTA